MVFIPFLLPIGFYWTCTINTDKFQGSYNALKLETAWSSLQRSAI
jgi:hypothetical protein